MPNRIILMADEREEFVTDVSGFIYYRPMKSSGMFSPHDLRVIADELDKRNEPLQKQLEEYFNGES